MITNIKKLPDSQVELTVELNKEELQRYVGQTEQELARDLKMDGFRTGKAPREIMRKKLGEEAIRKEAMELAVKSSLGQAIAREKLDVVDQLELKVKDNSSDHLVYNAKFLVMPEVILGSYNNLKIKKNEVRIEAREVDNVLAEVAKSRASIKEVERSAQRGDRIEIDFKVTDNGEEIKGGKSENHPLIIGEGKFVPGFEEKLIGMPTGGTKEFKLNIPDDYYQKQLAGKELDFKVTMKRVEEVKIPKVDNEFAMNLGKFESVDQLRQNIEQGLLIEKKEKEKKRVRTEILGKISSNSKTKIPKILVERQLDAMFAGLDGDLHQKGLELGPYLAHLGKTQEEMRNEWREQAESQVKRALILRTIARNEKISVDKDEVEQEAQAAMQNLMLQKQARDTDPADFDFEGFQNRIKPALLNEKIFNFLEKQNAA